MKKIRLALPLLCGLILLVQLDSDALCTACGLLSVAAVTAGCLTGRWEGLGAGLFGLLIFFWCRGQVPGWATAVPLLLFLWERRTRPGSAVLQLLTVGLGLVPRQAPSVALGTAVFLGIELGLLWRMCLQERTGELRRQAMEDPLTGVGNRRAFQAEDTEGKTVTVVCADVNDLKQTNDRLGHAAGDRRLMGVAGAMREFAGQEGKVFRMGGDEFVVLLYDVPEETLEQRLELLRQDRALALGWDRGRDLLKTLEEADRRMYRDKARLKS